MNWFQWSRGVAAAFLTAGAATLVLAVSPVHAANGTAMTCSTRTLSSLPLRWNGRDVRITSVSSQGVPCSKALALAKRVATDLVHGKPISLQDLAGLGTVSTAACGSCTPSTHVSLALGHGTVDVTLHGVGSGLSPNSGSFAFPGFPGFAIPASPLPSPPPAPGPTTIV